MGDAVIAAPLFQRLGQGSLLEYFAAGPLVGPSVLGLFTDPDTILLLAELGVVMFLFVIGLALRTRKLWAMRGADLRTGAGAGEPCDCLTNAGGRGGVQSAAADGRHRRGRFVLSSTSIIMSTLLEGGEIASHESQKSVSILQFEDLLIVLVLVVYVLVKAMAIYATARTFDGANLPALRRTYIFAQGGEFAFALYTAAVAVDVIDARENAIFSTVVILFMRSRHSS
ncbi:cation:proton antiporter [Algicella marina]|uniref:cation:proton antiporter domain-containing protein n=1 Tax=Algicella marina TaxID=2683284 RepID=UPI0024DFD0C5|nr:cation:proton antiporter [Algicella marina]